MDRSFLVMVAGHLGTLIWIYPLMWLSMRSHKGHVLKPSIGHLLAGYFAAGTIAGVVQLAAMIAFSDGTVIGPQGDLALVANIVLPAAIAAAVCACVRALALKKNRIEVSSSNGLISATDPDHARQDASVPGASIRNLEMAADRARPVHVRDTDRIETPSIVLNNTHESATTNGHYTRPPRPMNEDHLYADVAKELQHGVEDIGLWTRFFAECDGDETRTKVLYIQERVKRLAATERLLRDQQAKESAAAKAEIGQLISAYMSGKASTRDEITRLAYASSEDRSIASLRDRNRGKSLLHWCAELGLGEEAAILIANGADLTAGDANGRRAYQLTADATLRDLLAPVNIPAHGMRGT